MKKALGKKKFYNIKRNNERDRKKERGREEERMYERAGEGGWGKKK